MMDHNQPAMNKEKGNAENAFTVSSRRDDYERRQYPLALQREFEKVEQQHREKHYALREKLGEQRNQDIVAEKERLRHQPTYDRGTTESKLKRQAEKNIEKRNHHETDKLTQAKDAQIDAIKQRDAKTYERHQQERAELEKQRELKKQDHEITRP